MHDRQSPLISGLLDRAVHNIFGANFDFIPTTKEKTLNEKIKSYISRRMEARFADAARQDDFPDMAMTGLRAVWNDGDQLWVKRKEGNLLVFEADQVETPTDSRLQTPDKRIVLGVELDDYNGHNGYYVRQRLTKGDYGGLKESSPDYQRVPEQYAIFPAFRKRKNQTRGVPFLATILGFYDRMNDYIDYEAIAALANSMLGYKITRKTPLEVNNGPPNITTNTGPTNETFDKLEKMEPLMIFDLLQDEDIDVFGSQRPGDNFSPYLMICARILGVGVGMPLEILMLDFSQTNYSSGRMAKAEAKKTTRVWRNFAETREAMPWYRWQIARGIALGELPPAPNIFSARCQWPEEEYIDPQKEAQGNKIAVQSCEKTVSENIRARGGEPEEVFVERQQEIKDAIERSQQLKKDTGVDVPWQVFCGVDMQQPAVTKPDNTPADGGNPPDDENQGDNQDKNKGGMKNARTDRKTDKKN
jgi:lambda family phage portal protein